MSKNYCWISNLTKIQKKCKFQQMHAKHAILIWTLQFRCSLSFFRPIKSIWNIKLKKISRIRWDIKFFEKLTFGNLILNLRKKFLGDAIENFISENNFHLIKRKYKKMWPTWWGLVFLIYFYFIFVLWCLWWLWQQGFKIAQSAGDGSDRGSGPYAKTGLCYHTD
jgi:hypothetical protein